MRSTNENLLLWEQRINERTRSGMTVVDWCEKNGISKHKYHYWNHRISQNRKSGKEVAFAEVTPILSSYDDDTTTINSDKYADFQVLLNNIQVTVPSNFNPGALTGLLKVLKEL